MLAPIRTLTHDDAQYLSDESRLLGQAETISFPTTEAEIISTLAQLRATGTPLTIQGARTGITGSAVPFGGHVMNLSRMNRVLGLHASPENARFVVQVQPGLILSQLQKNIAEKYFDVSGWSAGSLAAYESLKDSGDWFFPADITEIGASVGGMLSTNASGARSFLYGPMRAHVLGITVILASGQHLVLERGQYFANGRSFQLKLEDGSLLRGRLPDYCMPKGKNAAGYFIQDDMDMLDLFIGSEGTLGIVTEMQLQLRPLPAVQWGVMLFLASAEMAVQLVQAIRADGSGSQPAAIEYFDAACLDLIRSEQALSGAHKNISAIPAEYRAALYVEFDQDTDGEKDAALLELGDLLQACGGSLEDTWLAITAQDREKLIAFRHALPESINRIIAERKRTQPQLTKLGSDMAVPDEFLAVVVRMYQAGIAASGLEALTFGHIGNNHLHINILPCDEDAFRAGKALFLVWAERVLAMGGTFSAEHGVGKLKTQFLRQMYGDAEIEKMRALKHVFDPGGMLNPGNMFSAGTEQS